MRSRILLCLLCLLWASGTVRGQQPPTKFQNPILPGFNPDPSICRVGDDYYMVTSSFTWYPGIPVYHSRDLVNWELIGHGIDSPDKVDFERLNDNDGIWAVTIRHHEGIFYLITTASKCGGNFYMTASNPAGPWSKPVWLPDAAGIDGSLFWDDDGRCYYTGNCWDFPTAWSAQCGIWMQELDLKRGRLTGERKILTYGHAHNATYAEGPHLYKIDGKYMLLIAEGGASYHHAVTVFHSDSLWGPYRADKVNPILTHRHLGKDFPIQNIGHADLVQTQTGEWYAVALGSRNMQGLTPLARETFLCKVDFEEGTPIVNPGYGRVLMQQERPSLPWTPWQTLPERDTFESPHLDKHWYMVRTPHRIFHTLEHGQLKLALQPEVIDSLTHAAMLLQKVRHPHFTAMVKLNFSTHKKNEQAGMVLYRTANGYYTLLKGPDEITLTRKHLGKQEIVATLSYNQPTVYLKVVLQNVELTFSAGNSPEEMTVLGGVQSADAISKNPYNKFNGPGIGVYATSNGKSTRHAATYDWFEYTHD